MPKGCSVTVVIQFKPQSQRPRDQLPWGKCVSADGLASVSWRLLVMGGGNKVMKAPRLTGALEISKAVN